MSNSTTVSCPSYAGISGSCAFGDCNSQGQCICHDGWTSRGDYEPSYYGNCDINIGFVRGLAVIIIVLCFVQACIALYNISNFDDYKLSTLRQPKSLISILFFIGPLGGIIYGCSRLADPINSVVAYEAGASVGFVVFFLFSNIGWALFSSIFSDLLKKAGRVFTPESQEKINKLSEFVNKAWPRAAALNWLYIPLTIISALTKKGDLVLIGIFIVKGIMVSTVSVMLISATTTFNKEIALYIASSAAAPEFHTLYSRTRLLHVLGLYGFAIPFGPVCIAFAAWDYLRHKATYFFMIVMVNYHVAIIVLIMQMKKSKSSGVPTNKITVDEKSKSGSAPITNKVAVDDEKA